jgi:hypothetical protein
MLEVDTQALLWTGSNGTPTAWVDGSARYITQTSSALPENARPTISPFRKMYVLDVGFSGRKAERRALIIYP